MISTKQRFAPLGLIIGCVVFGLGSVIVAHLQLGAYAIALWRLVVASIIFAALAPLFKQRFPQNTAARNNALIAGALLGVDLALWHESIYAVGPGISTLFNSLQIFWLAFIGVVWFRERLSRLQYVSLVIAVLGVGLIALPEFRHNGQALWGVISGIGSGLFLALSMVFVRKTHEAAPTPILPLMFYISLGGIAILLPLSLWLNFDTFLPRTLADIGWLVVYGALMQCFAWGMIAYCVPLLSLSLTGLLLLSEPVAALLIDYFFLAKPISLAQGFGALLTLIAIYLGSLKK